MTTGASRRRSRVRDHNGIAEVVAARIPQFANRGWGDKIGATQKVKALGAQLPSRPPRQLVGGNSHGYHFRQYVLDDMAAASSPAGGCPAGSADAPGGLRRDARASRRRAWGGRAP